MSPCRGLIPRRSFRRGIDGLEASRQIKAEQADVVVLLLSTYEREDFATRIAGSGASAFIANAAFGSDTLSDAWLEFQ